MAVDPLGRRARRSALVAIAVRRRPTAGARQGRRSRSSSSSAPLLVRRLWPIAVLVLVGVLAALLTAMGSPTPWIQVGRGRRSRASRSATSAGDRIRGRADRARRGRADRAGVLAQDANAFAGRRPPVRRARPGVAAGRPRPPAPARGRARGPRRRTGAPRARRSALRAAVAEERRHVARELHDVVAHGVSVMVIQAGAARQVVRTSPEQAKQSLLDGRGDRPRGDDRASAVPRRARRRRRGRRGRAAARARPARRSCSTGSARPGCPRELEVAGTPRPLPPSLDVTVYRIVQEALTNALRYARRGGDARAAEWEPAQLRIEILDDGPASRARRRRAGRGAWSGCASAPSRVGGRLEAGPRLGGGYAVRAWLPLEPEAS